MEVRLEQHRQHDTRVTIAKVLQRRLTWRLYRHEQAINLAKQIIQWKITFVTFRGDA
jgi:hypothetical protein